MQRNQDSKKNLRAILLMPDPVGQKVSVMASQYFRFDGVIVNDSDSLSLACREPFDMLIGFQTGVIVPKEILSLPGVIALNIHGASPDYPGRDPHHFAIYRGATSYGATLHKMIPSVDQGEILDVELFPVQESISPSLLLERANECGMHLIERFFRKFSESGNVSPAGKWNWGNIRTKRRDFIELCRITPDLPEEEFLRRLRAVEMPEWNNLYIDLYGYRFRIEGKAP